MKIALAQLNYHIGNFESNTNNILNCIRKAKSMQVDIVVFSELAISGYPPRDFLEFDHFVSKCLDSINIIASECIDIAAIIGSPSFNHEPKGKRLYNSAFFLCDGKVTAIRNKTLLPNYDVFDEYRYFEPNRTFEIIKYKGKRIALTICEDLWNITENPLYVVNPMDELAKQNPDLIINIAASPFNYEQSETRKEILISNAKHYNLPLFYVNHIGGQTELLFDGGSMVVDNKGKIFEELNYFEEDLRIYDLRFKNSECKIQNVEIENSKLQTPNSKLLFIHDALVMGIKDYFHKLGFKQAILGLSGGIDSAVTCVLAVKAMGRENVKGVLLPSRFSSDHSIKDAEELAKNLGISYEIIEIEEAFNTFEKTLETQFAGLPSDLAEENIQARVRAVILMALSNKFGYILLNTSNKSEAAVGYGTLYGDMCGGISVLGDVYKTQVYELANFINKDKEIIPINSIKKPPSAELRFDQKDSDSLPEYEILDKILFQYIEMSKGPDEIIAMNFDKNIVLKVLKMVNSSEWKRYQTPPILRISPKAFGMGRRMPIAAKYLI
ncbi:MAG: NAD+ synthase [Bacteroidetes bacterium]|nr:NAD+ synthase [Bacteroidota bacterium]